jgi:hypothetical protein
MSEAFALWIWFLIMIALFGFAIYEAAYDRTDA